VSEVFRAKLEQRYQVRGFFEGIGQGRAWPERQGGNQGSSGLGHDVLSCRYRAAFELGEASECLRVPGTRESEQNRVVLGAVLLLARPSEVRAAGGPIECLSPRPQHHFPEVRMHHKYAAVAWLMSWVSFRFDPEPLGRGGAR
jgi:hypothetical protein